VICLATNCSRIREAIWSFASRTLRKTLTFISTAQWVSTADATASDKLAINCRAMVYSVTTRGRIAEDNDTVSLVACGHDNLSFPHALMFSRATDRSWSACVKGDPGAGQGDDLRGCNSVARRL
jgi:hypothetical protein